MSYIITLLVGIVLGAVGAVLVARNNRSKINKALGAADVVSEKYKNYMTKWNDKVDKDELK
jgi:hypothetical protein